MVSRQRRSRSLCRVKVKTPTGVATHYTRTSGSRATCPVTGEQLHGVSSHGPASSKHPNRPFGGMLSSKGVRAYYKMLARSVE